MKQRMLAYLYTLINNFPDTPFNTQVLANKMNVTVETIIEPFEELVREKLIARKYLDLSIYKITTAGLEAAKQAYTDYSKIENQ
jgi:predicted transcriptional regulator